MATIYIYDEIGEPYFGLIGAKTIADELNAIGGEDVVVRINSPGGSVFEALAIRRLLNDYSGQVSVKIDALAASAATFLAPDGAYVEIAPQARFMIHSPWTMTVGNAADHRNIADELDRIEQDIIAIYMKRYLGKRENLAAMLEAETFMDAAEAVDHGFADAVSSDGQRVAACWRPGMHKVLDDYYRDRPTVDPGKARKEKAARKVRRGVTDFDRSRLQRAAGGLT